MWKVHLIERIEGTRFAVTIIAVSLADAQVRALLAVRRICPTAVIA